MIIIIPLLNESPLISLTQTSAWVLSLKFSQFTFKIIIFPFSHRENLLLNQVRLESVAKCGKGATALPGPAQPATPGSCPLSPHVLRAWGRSLGSPCSLSGVPFLPSGLRIQDVTLSPLGGKPGGSCCFGKQRAKEDGRPGRNGGFLGGLTTETWAGGGS